MTQATPSSAGGRPAPGPLAGLKVLEFAAVTPPSVAGMMLSGMGADVIRIDRRDHEADSATNTLRRGRRSIVLDLKHSAGRELARRLAREAAIVIEGYRPGVMERLGLGPSTLLEDNPALIYGRLTGWGQDGPCAQLPGHDITYLALTGALYAMGPGDGPPVPPLNWVADLGAGTLFLLLGVLAAETAENLAADFGIDRSRADAYAARSHQRAAAAWKDGRFTGEVVPVEVPQRRGDPVLVESDQGVRPDSTPETLGRLRPVTPGGTVTAGNAAQQNDAAAACLVVAEDQLAGLGLEPAGYLDGWAAAGCDPSRMGLGPVPAVAKLAARTGTDTRALLDRMDLVELNEAFAVQVLAVLEGWGWHDEDRLNVNGSGISLGHPIGATGMRMVTTLLHELRGGGQALAATVEAA